MAMELAFIYEHFPMNLFRQHMVPACQSSVNRWPVKCVYQMLSGRHIMPQTNVVVARGPQLFKVCFTESSHGNPFLHEALVILTKRFTLFS